MSIFDRPKCREAEETLPQELRPTFRSLVEDYDFATAKRYGRGYISYAVLADLVRAGWRGPAPAKREPCIFMLPGTVARCGKPGLPDHLGDPACDEHRKDASCPTCSKGFLSAMKCPKHSPTRTRT